MFRSCAGWLPPLFDQLQQRLAAIAKALALLERVEQGDDLARQSKQHAFASGSANTLAVSAGTFSGREMRAAGIKHPDQVISSSVGLSPRSVYYFFRRKCA